MRHAFKNIISMRLLLLSLFVSLLVSCSGTLPPDLPPTDLSIVPIYYQAQPPSWTAGNVGGLNRPTDIIAGYDNFFYVVDAGNNRIVRFDASGNTNGDRSGVSAFISRPKAIAQTRDFKLIVTASIDSTINFSGTLRTVPVAVLYRINTVAAGGNLSAAILERVYTQPIATTEDTLVALTGVATLGNNAFYVTRTGPNTARNPPDNAILLWDSLGVRKGDDAIDGPIADPNATGIGSVAGITSITTLAQPPQTQFVSLSSDFYYTTLSPNATFKVQRFVAQEGATGKVYVADPAFVGASADGSRYVGEPFRFKQPADICYAPDQGAIFVIDSETDSLYQFTDQGAEGITPPANYPTQTRISLSFSIFGAGGAGGDKFNSPQGVCYVSGALYVADTGNNRIVKFVRSDNIQ